MATRQSVDDYLERGTNAYDYAKQQYEQASKQEHYNDTEFTNAQQMLEDAVNDLNKLSLSSNDQQREQLYRMRIQLQDLQNDMILLRH